MRYHFIVKIHQALQQLIHDIFRLGLTQAIIRPNVAGGDVSE